MYILALLTRKFWNVLIFYFCQFSIILCLNFEMFQKTSLTWLFLNDGSCVFKWLIFYWYFVLQKIISNLNTFQSYYSKTAKTSKYFDGSRGSHKRQLLRLSTNCVQRYEDENEKKSGEGKKSYIESVASSIRFSLLRVVILSDLLINQLKRFFLETTSSFQFFQKKKCQSFFGNSFVWPSPGASCPWHYHFFDQSSGLVTYCVIFPIVTFIILSSVCLGLFWFSDNNLRGIQNITLTFVITNKVKNEIFFFNNGKRKGYVKIFFSFLGQKNEVD